MVALSTEQVAGARPRLAGCTDQQRLQRGVALDQLELERVAYMKEPALGSPRVTSGSHTVVRRYQKPTIRALGVQTDVELYLRHFCIPYAPSV